MEREEESQGDKWKTQRIKLVSPEWKWKWKLFTLVPETRATEPDRDCSDTTEFSIGDVEKSSGLSYTLQMNNPAASQNPSTLNQATVWGESRRGQLEAGVVFFYWLHHTWRAGDRREEWECVWCVLVSVCTRVIPHRSVMFKWECNIIFLPVVCFFVQ